MSFLTIPVGSENGTAILEYSETGKFSLRGTFPAVPKKISREDALEMVRQNYGGYAAWIMSVWDDEGSIYVTPDGLMSHHEIMNSPKFHVSMWAQFPYEQITAWFPFLTEGAIKGLILPGTRICISGDKGLANRTLPAEFAPYMDEALWARSNGTTYVWVPKLNRGFYISDAEFNSDHEAHCWRGEITPVDAFKMFWTPEPPVGYGWYVEFGPDGVA